MFKVGSQEFRGGVETGSRRVHSRSKAVGSDDIGSGSTVFRSRFAEVRSWQVRSRFAVGVRWFAVRSCGVPVRSRGVSGGSQFIRGGCPVVCSELAEGDQ